MGSRFGARNGSSQSRDDVRTVALLAVWRDRSCNLATARFFDNEGSDTRCPEVDTRHQTPTLCLALGNGLAACDRERPHAYSRIDARPACETNVPRRTGEPGDLFGIGGGHAARYDADPA